MGREFVLKALCIAVSAVPWVVLGASFVLFGVEPTLCVLWDMAKVVLGLFAAAVLVLFVRACGLELYERVFEADEAK